MRAETDELDAWLALASLATSGTSRWRALTQRLGSARAVLAASDAELVAQGLSAAARAALHAYDGWDEVARLRADCAARRIGVVAYTAAEYPELLRLIDDPPLVLYWRGAVAPAAVAPALAIVGARRATRYGLRAARHFGAALAAAGVWIVSGLARGIDAAAQAAALETGSTAAVLAGGVDRCFPSSNRKLAAAIVERGVVLSEYPPGTPTVAYRFPIRNRIITGMTKATVIVEAHAKGGSLVSARWALDQGRDVFAVPGAIDSPASVGTNALLRDGAAALLEPADLFGSLGLTRARDLPGAGRQAHAPVPEEPQSAAIYAELSDDPLAVDELARRCRLDEIVIMEKLTSLELDGLAERLPGGTYVRTFRAIEPTEQILTPCPRRNWS